MRKLLTLSITVFALLGTSVLQASAVDLPNIPVSVVVTSSSATNAALTTGALTVTWQKPEVDGTHPLPIAYTVTATLKSTQAISASTTVPMITDTTINYSTVLSGLTGGEEYEVVVTSKTSQNAKASALAVSGIPVTSPALPTGVTVTTSPFSSTVTWTAPSSSGGSPITGYVIKDGSDVETIVNGATTVTKTFAALPANASVKYYVKAFNANGFSAYTDPVEGKVPTTPGKPTAVTANPGDSTITVTWAAPALNGSSAITGYKIYLYNSSGAAVGNPVTSEVTNKELTNIAAGSYTVKVKTSNLVGDSDFSEASSVATIAAASALLANTPVFTPSILPNLQIGGTQAITVTSPSTETITVTATGTPTGVCTYTNGVVTAVAEGTCSVLAVASATSTYDVGRLTKVFNITKTLQTITFATIANQPLPGPYTASASSTSGLAVSFTATGNCSASGSSISFSGEGSCSITASQAGNGTFATANTVTRTFSITAGPTNNSNNNSGGGSSGGGSAPGPTPIVTPIPVATPSATPTPTPTPSATPSATPTPSVAPTATPKPSPSASKSAVTTKISTFAVSTSSKVSGPIKASTLNSGTTTVSVKSTSNFQPTLPVVKKGEKVTMVIKDAKGKSYTVAALTVSKSGSLKLPAVKFTQKGSYTITIKVGSKTKIVKVTSTK